MAVCGARRELALQRTVELMRGGVGGFLYRACERMSAQLLQETDFASAPCGFAGRCQELLQDPLEVTISQECRVHRGVRAVDRDEIVQQLFQVQQGLDEAMAAVRGVIVLAETDEPSCGCSD